MIYSLGQKKPQFNPDEVWIADSADLIGEVILSEDVSVWFNVTIRADNDVVSIGSGSNIQEYDMRILIFPSRGFVGLNIFQP